LHPIFGLKDGDFGMGWETRGRGGVNDSWVFEEDLRGGGVYDLGSLPRSADGWLGTSCDLGTASRVAPGASDSST
jgi:hypothetical protein